MNDGMGQIDCEALQALLRQFLNERIIGDESSESWKKVIDTAAEGNYDQDEVLRQLDDHLEKAANWPHGSSS